MGCDFHVFLREPGSRLAIPEVGKTALQGSKIVWRSGANAPDTTSTAPEKRKSGCLSGAKNSARRVMQTMAKSRQHSLNISFHLHQKGFKNLAINT